MTQQQLEHAVAVATGESAQTIRRLGFQELVMPPEPDPGPDRLALAVACPFCGRDAGLTPGRGREARLAVCDTCDVEFEAFDHEIHVTAGAAPASHDAIAA